MSTVTPQHLHVGDFGKDLDDEIAALVTAYLVKNGMVDLRGVVANLDPADRRARLAKGSYLSVGLDVPVDVGTSCGWIDAERDPCQFEADYLAPAESVDVDGQKHFVSVAGGLPDPSRWTWCSGRSLMLLSCCGSRALFAPESGGSRPSVSGHAGPGEAGPGTGASGRAGVG